MSVATAISTQMHYKKGGGKTTLCESKDCFNTAISGTFGTSKGLLVISTASHSYIPSDSTLLPAYRITRTSGS